MYNFSKNFQFSFCCHEQQFCRETTSFLTVPMKGIQCRQDDTFGAGAKRNRASKHRESEMLLPKKVMGRI